MLDATVPVGGQPEPLVAVDPDGDPLTYSVVGGSLPEGLVLNANGTWTGTAQQPGEYIVMVQVCDPYGACEMAVLSLTFTSQALPSTNMRPQGTPAGAGLILALVLAAAAVFTGALPALNLAAMNRWPDDRCRSQTRRGHRCRRSITTARANDGRCAQHAKLGA